MTDQSENTPTTAEEIEADIAATRERLTESVDALAGKMDVKAQAQQKVDETKAKAQDKVEETKAKAVQGARNVQRQVRTASLPVQIALAAGPVVVVALIIWLRSRQTD